MAVKESNVILVGARDLDPEEERQLQISGVKIAEKSQGRYSALVIIIQITTDEL